MGMYRIELEKLTNNERRKILNAFNELKQLNVSKSTMIFLLSEMNRMYKRELYTEKDLSCSDCLNNIKNFWKHNTKEWTV